MSGVKPRVVRQGFQALNSFDFSYDILGAAEVPGVGVAAFGDGTNKNVLKLVHYNSSEPITYNIPYEVIQLLYASYLKLYVAACKDISLKVFTGNFAFVSSVRVSSTIVSLALNANETELYTSGNGQIMIWELRYNLIKPLIPDQPLRCIPKEDKRPKHLKLSRNNLLVSSSSSIYIVDTPSRELVSVYSSVNNVSITSAALFKHDSLLIGIETGPIEVWDNTSHVHAYSLIGHSKAATSLVVHPVSPSIISCSLDKTIRVWNLENRIQTHNVVCEEEVLGMCWDHTRLTCYTAHSLRMWNVGLVESHFAISSSNVIKMERVNGVSSGDSLQRAERTLVVAEDGSVRLLSPISGRVITILFPMFSTQLMEDVLYSQTDELIFLLLKTNNVLVFDARYNPCLTRELWTPTVQYHKIGCFTMCHVVLSTGKIHVLVFGGQLNGSIVLIHSSEGILNMSHTCSSHRGRITNIVGSCELITKCNTPALVTYGYSDEVLKIWTVDVVESSCTVSLRLYLYVDRMECNPDKMLLTNATLCLVLEDCHLSILKLPDKSQSLHARSSMIEHQHNDDHKTIINSLVTCSPLQIIVTSSSDGIIKTWNLENQLISDLDIGLPVSSIGIANDRGDLLIGARNIISVLGVEEYLPCGFVSLAKTCPKLGGEKPIAFDPKLEFWYDLRRVNLLPLNQQRRIRYIVKNHLDLTDFPSEKLNASSVCLPSFVIDEMDQTNEINDEHSFILEQQVNLNLAKFHCQNFDSFALSSSCSASSAMDSMMIIKDFTCNLSASLSEATRFSCFGGAHELMSSPNRFYCLRKPQQATVALLLSHPSTKLLAPDGYIPNSVVRKTMNFVSPSSGATASDIFKINTERGAKRYLRQYRKSRRTKKKEDVWWTGNLVGSETVPSELPKPSQAIHKLSMTSDTVTTPQLPSRASANVLPVISMPGFSEVKELISKSGMALGDRRPESIGLALSSILEISEVENKSELPSGDRISQTLVTQTAVGRSSLAQITTQAARSTAEWGGASILRDAISKSWFPKEHTHEGVEPTVHEVYKGLMEAIRNADPAGTQHKEMLNFLLAFKNEKMLDDEELRDIGSPLTSLLETVIRQQVQIKPESISGRGGHNITGDVMGDASISDDRNSEAHTGRTGYSNLEIQTHKEIDLKILPNPKGTCDLEKSPPPTKSKDTTSKCGVVSAASPHLSGKSQPVQHQQEMPSKATKRHSGPVQPRTSLPHLPPDKLEEHKHLPRTYMQELEMDCTIRINGRGFCRQDVSPKHHKSHKLCPPHGNTPNYSWMGTKHYQKLAKGINVSGMNAIRAFINYPNAVDKSGLINKWMLGREEPGPHKAARHSEGVAQSECRKTVDGKLNWQCYTWKDIHPTIDRSHRVTCEDHHR